MKLLCVYPGMDPRLSDNFSALRYMREHGVELTILTRSDPGLKSTESSPAFEIADGIPIYRQWRNVAELNSLEEGSRQRVIEIADRVRPNAIWCSYQGNLPIGRFLKERYKVPLIVLVESLLNNEALLGVRSRWWRRPIIAYRSKLLRDSLLRDADRLITSDVCEADRTQQVSLRDNKLMFIPWCSHVPNEIRSRTYSKTSRRAVHIGSLYHFKNAQYLPKMIRQLIEATHFEEVVVVGPGPLRPRIESLKQRYSSSSFSYIESLSRQEALQLIAESGITFTPTRMGGWGLFGDSWAMRTPILSLHNPYALNEGVDASLGQANGGVVAAARRLFEDSKYYEAIQNGGCARYSKNHTAEVVGEAYLKALADTP